MNSGTEVEIKLMLPSRADYEKVQKMLGAPTRDFMQENVFFDGKKQELSSKRAVLRYRFYNNDEKCVITLKAKSKIVDGVARAEEVEEETAVGPARAAVAEASRSAVEAVDSELMRKVMADFGVPADGFVCLGGFKNRRQTYPWRGEVIELDETLFAFGTVYEIELETSDPDAAKAALEEALKGAGVQYEYSAVTKFARFIEHARAAAAKST